MIAYDHPMTERILGLPPGIIQDLRRYGYLRDCDIEGGSFGRPSYYLAEDVDRLAAIRLDTLPYGA